MKILGIDTTTKFLCIGIYDNSKIYEYNLELGTLQSSLLLPWIKRLLDALHWRIKDIDYFACGLGPGSFTGIRVGLSTIKGLTWALKKPILGISTLDIIACNAQEYNGIIIAAIDAKRNLIYCSAYKNNRKGLKRIMPYLLLAKDDFLKKIKPKSIILGDALRIYKEEILKEIRGANLLDKDYWYPKARNIMVLALEKIKDRKFNTFNIKPIYLYPKECQIRNV